MAGARKAFTLFGMIAIDGITKVKGELNTVTKELYNTQRAFKTLSKDVISVGKGLTAMTAPVVGLVAGMGALALKTGQYADSLLDLSDITGLTTDNLQGLEAVSREAGVEFTGLTGAISQFTNQLPKIVSGTGASAKAFNALGLNLKDSSGNIRDMNELFPEMLDKLRGIENVTERNATAQKLFGQDLSAIAPVLSMTTERFNELYGSSKNLTGYLSNDQLKSANEVRIEFENLKKTFDGIFIELSTSFIPIIKENLVPFIKDTAIPAFKILIDTLGKVFEWFNSLPIGIKDFILVFGGVLAVVGPVTMAIGALIPVIGSLITAIKSLQMVMAGVSGATLVNPIGLIIVAVTGLITAGVLLIKNWDKIKEKSIKVFTSISYFVKDMALSVLVSYTNLVVGIYDKLAGLTSKIPLLNKLTAGLSEQAKKENEWLKQQQALNKINQKAYKDSIALTKEEKSVVEEATKTRQKQIGIISEIEDLKEASIKKDIDNIKKVEITEAEAFNKTIQNDIDSLLDKKRTLDEKYKLELEYAEKIGADTQAVNKKWQMIIQEEELATAKKIQEEKEAYLEKYAYILQENYNEGLANLQKEKEVAIENAIKLGIEKERIEKYFNSQIEKYNAESQQKQIQANIDKARSVISTISGMLSELNNTLNMYYQLEQARIDANLQKQIDAINMSANSEEEKQQMIAEAQKKADAEKLALQREQAKKDKAMSIFNIAIKTAEAIMSAMTLAFPLNIVMVAFADAIGAAQTAIVASQSLPFAEGGYVKSTAGGVNARLAEAGQDELVLPMQTGVDILVSKIVNAIKSPDATKNNSIISSGGITLQIGTLIADDFGMKHLARDLQKYFTSENNRVVTA